MNRSIGAVGNTIALLSSLAIASCSVARSENNANQYRVEMYVTSDPGVALAGAKIIASRKQVGVTGPDGILQVGLEGAEGEVRDVAVTCPAEYRSPVTPTTITLRRLQNPKQLPRFEVSCPPTVRNVVVLVRAENGPNLPILHLGQRVAETDASGAATVALKLKPAETFELSLDTHDAPQLRPQNPVASFVVKAQDDVFLFEQRFDVKRKVVFRAPAPRVPTPL